MGEVADFAALAPKGRELPELPELRKIAEWTNELPLICKVDVSRD